MGEGEWFSQFCGALRINAEKRSSISYRTGRIVGQLNYDLRGKLDSKSAYRFYVGSYGRSTAIPSVSDVDLLYELPYALYQRFHGHAGNGQSALLALVKAQFGIPIKSRTWPATARLWSSNLTMVCDLRFYLRL